jgi:hypothetical protein
MKIKTIYSLKYSLRFKPFGWVSHLKANKTEIRPTLVRYLSLSNSEGYIMKSILYLLILVVSFTTSVGWAQSNTEYASVPERAATDPTKTFQIFPNPTTDYVHIRNEHVEMSLLKLTLHNIIGNEMKVEVEVVDEHELKVKVKDLSPGYYLIAIKDDFSKFRGTYKFLKR